MMQLIFSFLIICYTFIKYIKKSIYRYLCKIIREDNYIKLYLKARTDNYLPFKIKLKLILNRYINPHKIIRFYYEARVNSLKIILTIEKSEKTIIIIKRISQTQI
ncbi:protein of unknown function [Candidatus Nitrosocosmicus franklandus]|uniref:Uncharacterized protein n=1 Tax=Candidatus Nitrosocosmicus franklandianus TaxID=1798806 RepID=A0A484IGS2_9ARCH|nr:protein of unknown function [Candidatus Nitrosocosmicus franklandus]